MKAVDFLSPLETCLPKMRLQAEWLELSDIYGMPGGFAEHWRFTVRDKINWLFTEVRPRMCLVCSEPFTTFHLHHALVSRQDVRGWKPNLRLLIDTELNLVPLHEDCHLSSPPSREDCWDYQCSFYGQEIMKKWYYDLPWKTEPPRRL